MRKLFKKSITLLSAAVLSLGILSIPAVKDTFHINTAITVSAETIGSGTYGTKYSINTNTDVWLYFTITDDTKKTASISGCSTGASNVTVTIPETVKWSGKTYDVTSIADNAFKNQTNISELNGGKKLTSISNNAFYQCTNLSSVSLSKDRGGLSHLDSIGDNAFYMCSNLCYHSLSDTKNIGANAFYGCSSLPNILLYSTEYIGEGAFSDCTQAEYIDLSSTYICTFSDYCFYNCSNAKYIKLPSCTYTIGSFAFSHCSNFDKIYFPSGLTKINSYAFNCDHKLKTVMMPMSVTEVGNFAFNNCKLLKYFVCKNPVTTFGNYSIGYKSYTKICNFVIWGKGGKIKTYADNNGITYHDTSQAPALAKERYENYTWKFGNTAESLADSNGNYLIVNQHKPYDYNNASQKAFNGSCYGMATVSALASNGILDVKKFSQNQFSTLSSIKRSDLTNYMKSFINTCWSACKNINCNDYSVDSNGLMNDPEMLTYLEYITYGADACVLSYRRNALTDLESSHAIVCFGLEFKEDATDKNSSDWNTKNIGADARILVYDGNYPNIYSDLDFYVNTQTGAWVKGSSNFYTYYDNTNTLKSTFIPNSTYPSSGFIIFQHDPEKLTIMDINNL